MNWLKLFQRTTSSGNFIPEIDGLRFIAIASVFLCHINAFFVMKNAGDYSTTPEDHNVLNLVAANGAYGVHLFFVISGFILFLPFASYHLKQTKQPLLKNYYLRRLTRIEPPYFLVMLGLFILLTVILHRFTQQILFPSLLASLTYTHNFFYGRNTLPLINSVAWSLEIEVQFYLIAPFIAKLFSYKPAVRRRIIVILCIFFATAQHVFPLPFLSIYDFAHYFLIGFLLSDLWVSGDRIFRQAGKEIIIISGILFFCAIWLYRPGKNSFLLTKIGWELTLSILIFSFYYLVLFTQFWKSIFSKPILTSIGGMCYSIYLLHNPVIWSIDDLPFNRKFSNSYLLDWVIHFFFISFIVLVVSSAFYLLIEKPCMDKNWVKKAGVKLKLIRSDE